MQRGAAKPLTALITAGLRSGFDSSIATPWVSSPHGSVVLNGYFRTTGNEVTLQRLAH